MLSCWKLRQVFHLAPVTHLHYPWYQAFFPLHNAPFFLVKLVLCLLCSFMAKDPQQSLLAYLLQFGSASNFTRHLHSQNSMAVLCRCVIRCLDPTFLTELFLLGLKSFPKSSPTLHKNRLLTIFGILDLNTLTLPCKISFPTVSLSGFFIF